MNDFSHDKVGGIGPVTDDELQSAAVTYALRRCEKQAHMLREVLGTLEDRLGPVLSPARGADSSDDEQRDRDGTAPPLANELNHHAAHLGDITEIARDILNRLGV